MDRLPTSLVLFALTLPAQAQEVAQAEIDQTATELDRILVVGRRQDLLGVARSASEGYLGETELENRPRLRPGDLAEYIPGVAATQHSGSGKANQYFLRGFNLDHGTDFAQYVEGMPVNLRTHGHGHGYSDLNFIIPELVSQLEYRKGPYHAEVGDFSSAGWARYTLADRLKKGIVQFEAGQDGYLRVVAADSVRLGETDVTWAVEKQRYDGPWTNIDEDVDKKNLLLRASREIGGGRGHLLLLGYDNRWNSPDQVPDRAVRSGLIDELGSIDTTLGGNSSRRSISSGWIGPAFGGDLQASAYAIDYDLSLFSNFTYFLDSPDTGDQFRQFDDRNLYGFQATQTWAADGWQARAGIEGRQDDIDRVGLSRTQQRNFVSAIRDDQVEERSLGVWADGQLALGERWRATLGVRHDRFLFDVDALQPENSGRAGDGITSLKAGLAWRAAEPLEVYANWGQGLHSNDARGATIRIDPVSGDPAERVTPLVRSTGSEFGLRWFQASRWHATLALWQLDLDSELLFVGDAGTTEPSRPSERRGVELGLYYLADPRFQFEAEASWTRARFSDADPAGDRIPGAVPLVLSVGVTSEWGGGWHSSLRARHLGRYALIEDDSVESDGSTLLNLSIGKRWQRFGAELDVLNLLDSDDHDIDYFYASRLPGEPAEGVEDIHYHVFEPRSLRLRLTWSF